MGAPLDRDQIVVTSEPKTKVAAAKPLVNQTPPQVLLVACDFSLFGSVFHFHARRRFFVINFRDFSPRRVKLSWLRITDELALKENQFYQKSRETRSS